MAATLSSLTARLKLEVFCTTASNAEAALPCINPFVLRVAIEERDEIMKTEESSTPRKNKILVVEDHSHIRQILALRLKELGYEVFEAETGLDAFRQARATLPDLVLMDLHMPVVGGDEVMAWLKTDLLTRHIPIIVATALLFGPAVDRAIAAGAAEVIHKPFNFDALNTILQRHLPDPSGV